mmetsp:Transcript_22696/g.44084  ORF Transcript_22696/g.44084 Transcript_22696/m.44084 type:complete len:136 (+) Transcript_22696:3-410(+)
MLYSTWLLCEALHPQFKSLRLAMCAATVLLIVQYFGLDNQTQGLNRGLLLDAGGESDVGVSSDPATTMTERELRSFIMQSLMHAIVPLYWCSILAPYVVQASVLASAGHTIVVGLSLFIYAWHLVAPKILTHRHF